MGSFIVCVLFMVVLWSVNPPPSPFLFIFPKNAKKREERKKEKTRKRKNEKIKKEKTRIVANFVASAAFNCFKSHHHRALDQNSETVKTLRQINNEEGWDGWPLGRQSF